MGWVKEKKIFAAEADGLKKKCKKFPDEDDDYYNDEEDEDYGDRGSEASGCVGKRASCRAPDGGYGWLVLLAAFVLNVLVDGIGLTTGMDQDVYMDVFNATHSEVSLLRSSLTGCYLIVGPVAGAMCYHMGMRKVTIMGSVLTATGFILSSFANCMEVLIFTYGIIGGTGLGMMYLPSIVCVTYWFDKKLAIATGIAVCGSGIGQIILPPIAEMLLREYNWNGKNFIMGAIVLNGAVCGAILRAPDRWQTKKDQGCRQRVEIERGLIMKALIEDKKRQRTISDGSLDNCVITTNNRLIKLEPSLFHCDKSQTLRKMLRQLGYSIQSLNVSKNSLQPSNQQVLMEALQQQQQQRQQMNGSVTPTNNSPSTATTGQLQKRNSSPDFNKLIMNGSATADQLSSLNGFVSRSNSVKSATSCNGMLVGGVMMTGGTPALASCNGVAGAGSGNKSSPVKCFTKTRSCDALGLAAQQQQQQQHQQPYNMLIKKIVSERVRSTSECLGGTTTRAHLHASSLNNGSFPLGSSPALPVGSVDISIQEIPADEAENVVGSCYTSNTSLATDISGQYPCEYMPNSSRASYVTRVELENSLRELNRQKRQNSRLWSAWYIVQDMGMLIFRPVFSVFLLSSLFIMLSYFVPYYYLTTLGMDIGMEKLSADFLLSILSVTSTVGRVIVGWLGDRPWINPLFLNNGALLLSGLCCLVYPSLKSPQLLCVATAIFGFCLATFVALRSVLLVKYLGQELIPKTFGLLCLIMGLATFIGTPLSSKVLAETGSLAYVFYMAGLFTIMSGLILLPLGYLKRREERINVAKAMAAEEEEEMAEMVECNGYLRPEEATGGVGSPVHQCSMA